MSQTTIRWEEVRRRIQISQDSLGEALSESPERINSVFRQRAAQLAKAHAAHKPTAKGIPSLVFRLGQERYAIALKELAEVLAYQGCTPVPGMSQPFLGVINVRGELRPVIDLARVLSGDPSIDSGAVLILRRQAALKVDAIEDLREIRSDELERPVQGQYVNAFSSGTLGLLDVETVLSTLLFPKESRPI